MTSVRPSLSSEVKSNGCLVGLYCGSPDTDGQDRLYFSEYVVMADILLYLFYYYLFSTGFSMALGSVQGVWSKK